MGIPAGALEQVFERYARIESGPARHIEGTGLGLPIVKQIVEVTGGAVNSPSEGPDLVEGVASLSKVGIIRTSIRRDGTRPGRNHDSPPRLRARVQHRRSQV